MKKTLLVSAMAFAFASNAMAASDARSFGMGGIGVTTSDYLSAPVHNPALAAKYKDVDDIGLMLPSISANLNDNDELFDKIDDLQDLIDEVQATPTADGVNGVKAKLEELDGKSATVQAQALLAVAIPNEYLASTFFVSARVDAIGLLDYNGAIGYDVLHPAPDNIDAFAAVTGVAVIDYGVALARHAELGEGTFYYGVTPKMQQVRSILYTATVDSFDDDDFDSDEYMTDETNFNMDIGVAYELNDFTYGLTVKDLISKTYKTKISNSVQGSYKIQPVATAGVSYALEYMTVGADIDLNKSERISALSGSDYDTSKDDTQMAAIGAEFDAWHWAQLRVGYQWDLQNNLDPQYTAGIGLSPFDTIHLDLSASYGGDSQYGAALDLAFMF